MELFIKNITSDRFKINAQSEIKSIGFQNDNVGLAIVNMEKTITPFQHSQFDTTMKKNGFELFDDRNNELINNLKKAIIELEVYSDEDLNTSFADFTSLSFEDNFSSLNRLFADIEEVTIDKQIIKHKIARMKELLVLCMMISCLPKLQPVCNTAAQQN